MICFTFKTSVLLIVKYILVVHVLSQLPRSDCCRFCNALVHVIYLRVSGQYPSSMHVQVNFVF